MKLRPPSYVTASFAASLAGLCNGYDTGAIGGLTAMPQFRDSLGALSPSLLGFTVSLVMLTGAVPSFFAGYLADRYGRLRIILAGTVLYVAGAVLQGAAYTLPQFLVGRAVVGLGEGVFLSNASVYVCEIAPLKQRGMLAGLPQFLTTVGICAGYFTCYGSVGLDGSMAWRVPYVFQAAMGGVLVVSCLFMPESPRWLVVHGRRAEALQALEKLEFDMVEAERDVLAGGTEQQAMSTMSLWQSVAILFKRAYRTRTILALFILGMVQLSGIDAVIYYAPVLFSQAGLSSATAAFLASGVSAILMLAITIPASLFADKWGRRTSAITGGLTLSSCMFLMGSLYAAGVVHPWGAARWVVIVSVFVFSLTFCATWGIVGKIYASEIQPNHTRAAANCVAQGLGFFTNWLVAILTPILLDKSAYGAYFLFGGLSLGTVAVLAVCMPETRGRSLENIQEQFHQPSLVSSLTHLLQPLRRRTAQAQPAAHDDGVELAPRGSSVPAVHGLYSTISLHSALQT